MLNGNFTFNPKEIGPEVTAMVMGDLTFKSFGGEKYGFGPANVVSLWSVDDNTGMMTVPRRYALEKLKVENGREDLSDGSEIDVQFRDDVQAQRPELKARQDNLIVEFMVKLGDPTPVTGGIFSMPCGTGKTVCALKMLSMIKRTALVIVHTEFLMDQWEKRIVEFTNVKAEEVGRVQGDECDFEGKKIVIGMVQSLTKRSYPMEFYRAFGVIFCDEAHRMSAPIFNQAIPLFNAKIRIGLTATPKRSDGLQLVFEWHIGKVLAKMKGSEVTPKIFQVPFSIWMPEHRYKWKDKIFLGKLVSYLSQSDGRNAWIHKEVVKAVRAGRKVMVLSDRREHLAVLKDLFDDEMKGTASSGFYVGGMKQAAREKSAQADALFGTFQLAKEGLDIPAVDTLFLTTPHGDVEQACVPDGELVWVGGVPTRVEDVAEGALVRGLGGSGRVYKVWARPFDSDICVLKGMYVEPLRLTPEHPVFVRRFGRSGAATRICGRYSASKVYGDVEEITAGDLCRLVSAQRAVHRDSRENYSIGVPVDMAEVEQPDVNENRAELLGWYLAEGDIKRILRVNKRRPAEIARGRRVRGGKQVRFSFGSHEADFAERVRLLVRQEFGANASVTSGDGTLIVTVYSTRMAEWIDRYIVGGRAGVKELAEMTMRLPRQKQAVLLSAAVRGDGCTKHARSGSDYVAYSTASRKLALQVQMLWFRAGRVAGISKNSHVKDVARFSKEPMWEVVHSDGTPHGRLEGGVLWVKVMNCWTEKFKGVVRNFSVDPVESYSLVGGVVHNCGRILRFHEDKKEPIVVDIVDSLPICKQFAIKRLRQYKKLGYDVQREAK